jgi:polysaccharide export outer membrane protein
MRVATVVAVALGIAAGGVLAAQQPAAAQNAAPSDAGPAAKTADEKAADARSAAAGAPVDPKAYIIGPEDVLRVLVWREPENSGTFVVRPDGKIAVPLIGEVQAAGLTPERLRESVATGLQKILTHPEVTVIVDRVNSKKYYIQGEINRPGAYPLVVPTTVLEALVNAGGFRDFANTKKITILRGTQTFKFNYKDVSKGKKMDQNIQLQPGDQIFVP